MADKKIPYAVQLSLAIAAQNDELAHNIYGCPVCCNQSCSHVVKLEEQKNG